MHDKTFWVYVVLYKQNLNHKKDNACSYNEN